MTHQHELIGLEIPEKYDGVSYWVCPKEKRVWDRFTKEELEGEEKETILKYFNDK